MAEDAASSWVAAEIQEGTLTFEVAFRVGRYHSWECWTACLTIENIIDLNLNWNNHKLCPFHQGIVRIISKTLIYDILHLFFDDYKMVMIIGS